MTTCWHHCFSAMGTARTRRSAMISRKKKLATNHAKVVCSRCSATALCASDASSGACCCRLPQAQARAHCPVCGRRELRCALLPAATSTSSRAEHSGQRAMTFAVMATQTRGCSRQRGVRLPPARACGGVFDARVFLMQGVPARRDKTATPAFEAPFSALSAAASFGSKSLCFKPLCCKPLCFKPTA